MQQVLVMDDAPKEEMDIEQTILELTSCIAFVAAQWSANLQVIAVQCSCQDV